ncbi:MAG TPA: tetratricopeptide repeat protein, partial [Polyangium sp.]|nr:tetratricopeptide repeat protein [Polyangium sp.]
MFLRVCRTAMTQGVLLVWLAQSTNVFAQPAPSASSSATPNPPPPPGGPEPSSADTYKQHMSNGVKLFNDGNFGAAVAEFEAAYAERPRASPLVNLALCHKSLFQYPKAIAALERALELHSDTMEAEDRAAA